MLFTMFFLIVFGGQSSQRKSELEKKTQQQYNTTKLGIFLKQFQNCAVEI